METNRHNWNNIFNRDFYPTPETVIQMMNLKVSGETILEPSAGKGNIIDYCKQYGAKNVLFCEINPDLAEICKSKAQFLKHDFLKVTQEEISHVTQIIMNPPFTTIKRHILHAWEIAPDGCEITTLINTDTLDNLRYDRNELKVIIDNYGITTDLGNVFNLPEAERKTDVSISLVKLYKPISNENTSFEGFYMDMEPEQIQENGVMHYNEVQALVNGYIAASKCFDEFEAINERMINICRPVGMDGGFSYSVAYKEQVTSKSQFLKALQRKSWKHIFSKMNLNKYLTSGVMQDINRFVENQTQVPFTVKNIFRMFEIIIGTKEHNFNRALEEAVDSFTKHTHENRFGVEGWKTNSGYMLNKKFIINYAVTGTYSGGMRQQYTSRTEKLTDLIKVLCNMTGQNFDKMETLHQFFYRYKIKDESGNILEYNDNLDTHSRILNEKIKQGEKVISEDLKKDFAQWYDFTFFKIRGYKKGTMHLKFTSDKIWEQLNRAYAKIKGEALPETTWKHKEQTETRTTESKPKTPKQPKTTAETNPIVQALIQQPINSETILNMFN
jgi:hypothetical protein